MLWQKDCVPRQQTFPTQPFSSAKLYVFSAKHPDSTVGFYKEPEENRRKHENLNRGQKLGEETRLGPILSPLEVHVKSVRCICLNLLKHCQKSSVPHVLPAQHVLHPLHS